MDRLHVHVRAVAASLLLVAGCTCADRALVEDAPNEREAACMWLIGARGSLPDGRQPYITNEDRVVAKVCLCLTQQEYDQQLRHDELNDMALAECRRLADLSGYEFIGDPCLEYYEQGDWLNDVFWAEEPFEEGPPPGFTCE